MELTLEAIAAASKSSGGKKAGARVTEGVIKQVEAKGATQACIAIHGGDEVGLYRGDVTLRLGDRDYVVTKTDSHACWATKQGANGQDFIDLFNRLAETPNKYHGTVILPDAE